MEHGKILTAEREDSKLRNNLDATDRVFTEIQKLERIVASLKANPDEAKQPIPESHRTEMSFEQYWGCLVNVFVEIQQRIDKANDELKKIIIG